MKNYDFNALFQSLNFINPELMGSIFRGSILLIIGYIILHVISFLVGKFSKKNLSKQSAMIIQKGFHYTGMFLLLILVLQQFGVKLSALLGAAGIVGIALGFASQTSVSNIISGIFLIGEKPFEVGDLIMVGDKKGVVLSIDLPSIKIRTFDNLFIRIPNENLIKAEVTNITKFPIRRMDIKLGVAYKEDIRRVLEILKDIADKNPHVLNEPEPFIMFDGFGDSALEITYGIWFVREDWIKTKKEIMFDIKERFDAENIEIPFPHRTIYAGSATGPFPVKNLPLSEKRSLEEREK